MRHSIPTFFLFDGTNHSVEYTLNSIRIVSMIRLPCSINNITLGEVQCSYSVLIPKLTMFSNVKNAVSNQSIESEF